MPRRPPPRGGRPPAGGAEHVVRDVPQPGAPGMHHEHPRPGPGRLADPKVQDRKLLFGVDPDEHDDLGPLDVAVRDRHPAGLPASTSSGTSPPPTPWSRSLVTKTVRASFDSANASSSESLPPARNRPCPAPTRHGRERLGEGHRLEPVLTQARRGEPLEAVGEGEREPALVAQPTRRSRPRCRGPGAGRPDPGACRRAMLQPHAHAWQTCRPAAGRTAGPRTGTCLAVRAPTGQICIVLPEKDYELLAGCDGPRRPRRGRTAR